MYPQMQNDHHLHLGVLITVEVKSIREPSQI